MKFLIRHVVLDYSCLDSEDVRWEYEGGYAVYIHELACLLGLDIEHVEVMH